MARTRRHKEGGGTDAFETHDTPERPVADPVLTPLAGPQADATSPGEGAPAGDPRSPSGPEPAMVDRTTRVPSPPGRGPG
jgi:hypothetical protein